MSKSLQSKKNARSGHISIVTRAHNSVEDILRKNIANITKDDVHGLESARDICEKAYEKIEGLDQEILDTLAEEEDSTEAMETECEKITEDRMKVATVI